MVSARQGRRQWRRRGEGGGDGGGKGGSRWTRQDEGAGRRRRQWRCVGPEISLPLGVRGEERGGERSRLVMCMFYLPYYLESVRKTPFFR
jgi:hypothetical protein